MEMVLAGDCRALLVVAKVIDNIHRAADRQKYCWYVNRPPIF